MNYYSTERWLKLLLFLLNLLSIDLCVSDRSYLVFPSFKVSPWHLEKDQKKSANWIRLSWSDDFSFGGRFQFTFQNWKDKWMGILCVKSLWKCPRCGNSYAVINGLTPGGNVSLLEPADNYIKSWGNEFCKFPIAEIIAASFIFQMDMWSVIDDIIKQVTTDTEVYLVHELILY